MSFLSIYCILAELKYYYHYYYLKKKILLKHLIGSVQKNNNKNKQMQLKAKYKDLGPNIVELNI